MRAIVLILAAMCLMVTGCKNSEKTITLAQIEDAFEAKGVPLTPAKVDAESVPQSVLSMPLHDVPPVPFTINDGQRIFVYIYSSSEGVRKAEKDFENKTAAADVVAHGRYPVANALIVYDYESGPGQFSGKDARVERVVQELKSLVRE